MTGIRAGRVLPDHFHVLFPCCIHRRQARAAPNEAQELLTLSGVKAKQHLPQPHDDRIRRLNDRRQTEKTEENARLVKAGCAYGPLRRRDENDAIGKLGESSPFETGPRLRGSDGRWRYGWCSSCFSGLHWAASLAFVLRSLIHCLSHEIPIVSDIAARQIHTVTLPAREVSPGSTTLASGALKVMLLGNLLGLRQGAVADPESTQQVFFSPLMHLQRPCGCHPFGFWVPTLLPCANASSRIGSR